MEYTITGKTRDKLEEKLALYKKLTALRDELTERLQKTESQRDSVSPKIFEKVRQEYTSKLENVRNQLSPIQSELIRDKKECEDELPRLADEIRVLEDELAEAEFRFRVGEYTQTKLTEIQTRLNPDLAEKSELQAHLTERLEKIDAGFAEAEPRHDAAEPEASSAPEGENPDGAADDASSSRRMTLASEDPLEALTEKRDEKPADAAEDQDGGTAEATQEEIDDVADDEESNGEFGDVSFENPQEWIDELGNDDSPGAETAAPENTHQHKTSRKNPKTKDDPLSALADPSGDMADEDKTKTAQATAKREEISTGFPNMVIITGPSSGKKIPLLPMTMSIGREHDNNIELKDPDVGRYHARILYDRGRFVLEDLESSNGTWLNGEKISEAGLKNGDRIKIGETELAIDFD